MDGSKEDESVRTENHLVKKFYGFFDIQEQLSNKTKGVGFFFFFWIV